MADPITLGSLAVFGLGSVVGGIIGNRADSLFCSSVTNMTERMKGLSGNHHALRAMRRAQMEALEALLKRYREGDAPDRHFLSHADHFVQNERNRCDSFEVTDEVAQAMEAQIAASLVNPVDGLAAERIARIEAETLRLTWAEFSTACHGSVPDAFRTLFYGHDDSDGDGSPVDP